MRSPLTKRAFAPYRFAVVEIAAEKRDDLGWPMTTGYYLDQWGEAFAKVFLMNSPSIIAVCLFILFWRPNK